MAALLRRGGIFVFILGFVCIFSAVNSTVAYAESVTGTIPVGNLPSVLAISPDGSEAWVLNENSNSVSVIQTSSNTVLGTISLLAPKDIVFSPDGSSAYIADGSTHLYIVDTSSYFIASTIVTPRINDALTISPDGTKLYVLDRGGGFLAVYGLPLSSSPAIPLSLVNLAETVTNIAVSPNGQIIFVTGTVSSTPSVSVIDTSTYAVTNTITVGANPAEVVFSPDGLFAYVTNTIAGTLSVINVATSAVSNFPVGSDPLGVAVSPDGSKAYVTLSGSNSLVVFDLASNTLVGTPLPLGTVPYGVAFTPNGATAFVANYGSNNVSVVTGPLVSFNPNGGSGLMKNQTPATQPANLFSNTFTRAGYTFLGWNTQQDGSGSLYLNGASYPFNGSTTLYAQWASDSPAPEIAHTGRDNFVLITAFLGGCFLVVVGLTAVGLRKRD